MTEEQNPNPGADDELVTPEEHAEAFDVEIAARSADMDSPSTTHEKVFVLGPGVGNPKSNPYTEANGFDHGPNKAATRQYAIDAGLWPTGDVSFKSAKKHPDGVSWILTYRVPVIPTHVEQHDDVTGDKPTD